MHTPHRKRLVRREIPWDPRFITCSCEHRLALLGSSRIRDEVVRTLAETRRRFEFDLYAFVVMPEHVHLLARPRAGIPLARILAAFKQSVAQLVLHRWRELDAPVLRRISRPDGTARFWLKGGGFDRNPRDEPSALEHIRYIHDNPVERGLVPSPELWKWSSIHSWLHDASAPLHCDPPPGDPRKWQAWKGFATFSSSSNPVPPTAAH